MKMLILIVLAAAIVFISCPTDGDDGTSIWDGTADTSWYDYSKSDFYIDTAPQLAGLAELVNNTTNGISFQGQTVTQMVNINLDGKPWKSIGAGTITTQFAGTYNGNGKTIRGLVIEASTSDQGLFGYISSFGTVKNVKLINIYISVTSTGSSDRAGGVAGRNLGTVQGCSVTGSIKSSVVIGSDDFGGVVGYNEGMVQGCSFSGSIEATGSGDGCFFGGVVGYNMGKVENCYSTGSVKGKDEIGGVVGRNDTGSELLYCYSTCSVSGLNNVGGVAGENNSTVKNCVALNKSITGKTSKFGRVAGGNTGTLTNNYAAGTMLVNGYAILIFSPEANTAGKEGASITAALYNTSNWWVSLPAVPGPGFNLSSGGAWRWDNVNKLPVLK